MQMKQVIEERTSQNYHEQRGKLVKVDGENYEVKGTNAIIADLIGHLRLVCFALLFVGDMFFGLIGGLNTMPRVVKDSYGWITENKI